MSSRHAGRAVLAGVALIGSLACGDSPITPEELGATQETVPFDQMADRELLMAVLTKLNALEEGLARDRAVVHARLDSLSAVAGSLALVPPEEPGAAGANNMAALIDSIYRRTRMTDSIMDLASFIAEDVAEVYQGFELCAGFDLKGQVDLKSQTEARGNAEGGVGVKPWDTGALAEVALGQKLALEFGLGLEAGGQGEWCWDVSNRNSDPPVRTAAASTMARAEGPAQLESAIVSLQTQMGLNEQMLQQALTSGTNLYRSGDVSGLGQLATTLNLPTPFRDPLGHVRTRLTSFDPVGLLCAGTNFGTRFASVVSQGCGFIQSNDLPQLEPFLRLGNNFSQLQSNFGSLQNRFGAVCSRFNQVLDRRLRVDVDLPWGGDTPLDVRLFPSDWGVTC